MKKHHGLLVLAFFFHSHSLFSQYRKSIPVKAGEDAALAFSPSGFYRFPEFSTGTLFSRKASGNSARLFNYDMLSDKIQFIGSRGDTLDMVNPALFDSISINNRIFYYREDPGFLELLAANQQVRLVKKTSIRIKSQPVGAYDGTSSTSAINKLNTYVISTNVYTCKINEDVVVKEYVDWFWMSQNGALTKATKKNLLSLLPAYKRDAAEELIKQFNTDFSKETGLIKLLSSL